jgi:hypothetical protein
MFIRFVTDQPDEDTGIPVGVFAIAYRLLDNTEVDDCERTEIRKTLDWFKTNLPIPKRFVRSRKPHRQDRGICWFKSDAIECVTNIRYLVHLVREQNVIVRELTTETPGYMIYEDRFQVVAEPFATTPR